MKLTEGITVYISVQALYERFNALSSGHMIFANGDYYDLYDSCGNLACMDGEEVTIEKITNDRVTFRNDNGESDIYFDLTLEEAAVAIGG